MQRYLIILITSILLASNGYGQGIEVTGLSHNAIDLSAGIYPRHDLNNKECALIKVLLPTPGVTFEGNVVGESEFKTNEYWVYVTDNTKQLKIKVPGALPLLITFADHGITNVKSKQTYELSVNTGTVHPVAKSKLTSQYVMFVLNPSNAVVEIDGQMIENVDGTAIKRMPFGSYSYKVQAPRYASHEGTVIVNDANNKHTVTVKLVPQFSSVTFSVDGNAEIWIDNQLRGTGSCTLELGYGTYLVECRKHGFRSSQQEIVVNKENASQPVRLKSPTPIYGSLDINSTPADAEVWIDGKQAGTSPMFISECLIGSHQVILKKQGYKDKTLSINVSEGQTASLMETMEKGVQAVASSSSSLASSSSSGNTITVNGVSFEMIPVEGGTFRMGSKDSEADDDEKPVHSVTLSSYAIGKTEVTQALWKAVMGSNPSYFKGDNLPVEKVSWNDCQKFISKLNQLTGMQFRLPTEAEWEYAARGGNKSRGYKYSGSNDINAVAWYKDNSGSKTHNVGTKRSNELGIYDMSGNVWEWCQDWYYKYSSSAQTNPAGPSSEFFRVFRGGCWGYNARNCRTSLRVYRAPDRSGYILGLRLALSQ